MLSTGTWSTPRRYHPLGRRSARARMHSRSWRRTRFRTTAVPIRFGVEKATRTPPAASSSTTRTLSPWSRIAREPAKRAKPTRRGIRPITPTNERDPWSGAISARRDQLWSSSAYEIRVSLHGDAYWVEMYVSRLSPDVTFKAIGSNVLQARAVDERSQRDPSRLKHPRCDLPFCPLWKTCYVPCPATCGCRRHTALQSYTTGILHMMWGFLWMTRRST